MFKSEFEGSKQVNANISPVRIVTHKRLRSYTNKDGLVSHGWEIVKEISVSPEEVEAVRAKFGDGVVVEDRRQQAAFGSSFANAFSNRN